MTMFALLLPLHMQQKRTGELRGDVPQITPPPDRTEWEREHGKKPYCLTSHSTAWNDATKSNVDLSTYINQASAAISRDASTIERDKAIGEQVTLDHVCQRVKVELNIPNGDQVFFDPSDNHFWVYPEGKIQSGTQEIRK